MAAVTAAVIGATATVAATAGSIAQSQGAFGGGGGGGGKPEIKKIPMDPNDKAMRDYYARLTVANANTRYPSFGKFLGSGGDPAQAQMNINMPDLKPSEAAALGFTGPHGENIPGVDYEKISSGEQQKLTPEQIMYLTKERARTAQAEGRDTPKWAARTMKLNTRKTKLEQRIGTLSDLPTRTPQQENKLGRLKKRYSKVSGNLENIINPPDQTAG